MRKVFKCLWRLRRKYLSVFEEYTESIYLSVNGEYGKLGLFRYTKLSPNMRKVFKGIQRICVKNLCLHEDDKKRLLANSPNTPRDIKVCISQ